MEHISHALSVQAANIQRFTVRRNLTECPFCSRPLNHIRKTSVGAHKTCKDCQCTYFVPEYCMKTVLIAPSGLKYSGRPSGY